ncbi:hypothetical protein [Nitratifractor sp.]|uniref:hypothetical protein n=1 Tax=Nitratifractor sp. TaxID=2268144 RepID=UPI0025DD2C22|nr:hypothetical protein [Nitratifractor sp.]
MNESIEAILYEAIAAVNEDLGSEELENPTPGTPLFEALDSMAVLDLILELEAKLQERYGRYIQIADEKSMDPALTPFKTVQSATEHIEKRIENG